MSGKSNVQNQDQVWWRHLLAGAIGGATAKTVTAPIDRIKIFAQVQAVADARLPVLVKKLYKEGGLRSFWRGNAISVVKIIPESSTKFLIYDVVKRAVQKDSGDAITVGERFIAGSAAGVISQTLTYPLDVVKTNLALQRDAVALKGTEVISRYYKKYGVRWFYKGYFMNLAGAIVLSCIDLPLYEVLKMKFMQGISEGQKPPLYVLLGSALCTSIVSQCVTYPIAMVTTCIQAKRGPLKSTLKTVTDIVKEKLQTHGFLGLYDGLLPAMMKAGPATCVSFVVYEKVLSFLGAEMSK